ncbi:MAG TPA: shikimate kinase, partial [Ignavibacteriaceae bacterium]|nr:shikimate kinase [Ignavibacteriaceae bacterium]
MKISRIYITGFMGSGKSTLGPIVANTIGWNSYDIDSEIEKRTGMKVTEIFKSKGEKFFRELESSILDEHSREPEVVVSLG